MASAVLSLPIPFLLPRRLMFCSITISSGKCRGKYVSICNRILFRKNKPFRENGACWVIRITNSASVPCEWKFSLLLLFHAPMTFHCMFLKHQSQYRCEPRVSSDLTDLSGILPVSPRPPVGECHRIRIRQDCFTCGKCWRFLCD